jgi:methyl-accepting chemotaxis protein
MAERTNQKEIRLTLQEGKDLVTDLALVTSRLASTINEVNQSLKTISENTKNIEVKFDGGGF